MEASSSQFPSSRTRKRTKMALETGGGGGSGDNLRTVVITRNLDEDRLKARERQRRKRERDRAGRDTSSGSPRKKLQSSEQEAAGDGSDFLTEKEIKDLPTEERQRLKARERQRRKRERDRSLRGLSPDVSRADVGGALPPQNEEILQITSHPSDVIPTDNPDNTNTDPSTSDAQEKGVRVPLFMMTPEERAKKEKIRQGARERQRKHRASVKARRMAEMNLSMSITENGEEPSIKEHEHHEPVMEDIIPHPYHLHNHPHDDGTSETLPFPFSDPRPYMTLGQAFAQIMLVSLSYTPMLKQELLQSLRMSEEDLISLMPMIASAWDQWNYDRSLHHATNTSPSGDQDHNPNPNPASTSYIPPPSPNTDANPDQDSIAETADTAAGQSPELSNLPSTDFPETPLVSIIYHLKNRLGQFFTRENRIRR